MNIPNLQDDAEITIEHCSVLLEKLGKCLREMYQDPEIEYVAGQADCQAMAEHLGSLFSREQFHRMFKTEIGKGILVGVFFSHFILGEKDAE